MELIKRPVHYCREGKRTFDQFYLDEDYHLPEAKEDVQRIIESNAEAKVEDVRPVENYVRITGKICFQILYMTSSGDPRPEVLEGKLPFEEMVYTEGNQEETCFVRNIRTEFNVSVIHARKLTLRVMVEAEIGREKLEDEETTVDVESDFPVCTKKKKVDFLKLAITKKETYRIKEEIVLPGTKDSIGQILLTDVDSRKLQIRLGREELQIRGELLVFCMYMTAEEKTDWVCQSVPYEGVVHCEGVSEEMYYNVHHTLEDKLVEVRMDEDGELRVLGIEGTLTLKMKVYCEEEMELLEDLYSPVMDVSLRTREAVYEELLMQNQSKCKITERLALPELKDDVLQIIHSRGTVQAERMQNTAEGIRAEGILHVSFLYLRPDDMRPYGSWRGMIPFSHLIESPSMPKELRCSMEYHTEQLQITPAGSDAVEIRAVLTFDTFLRKAVPMEVITEATAQQPDQEAEKKRPGIVGHIVREKEDLWSLAKRYRTTEEKIRKMNGLGEQNVKTGDKLLIFRENIGIL